MKTALFTIYQVSSGININQNILMQLNDIQIDKSYSMLVFEI